MTPKEFQISNSFYNVKGPSKIATGLEKREFGNLLTELPIYSLKFVNGKIKSKLGYI